MLRILLQFWPALLPLIAYGIWYLTIYKPKKKKKEVIAPWQAKLWIMSLGFSVVVLLICVFVLVLSEKPNTDGTYVPATVKDGKVIPGSIGTVIK